MTTMLKYEIRRVHMLHMGVWWWLVAQPSGIYALRASYKSYFYMIMGFIL